MTIDQVRSLHNGDEVFWNDPDEGLCSRPVTIRELTIHSVVNEGCETEEAALTISERDGGTLECFASELS